jgi:hypothetical protein
MCVFTKVIAEFELREGLLHRDVAQASVHDSAPRNKGKSLRDGLARLLRYREVFTKRIRAAGNALSRYTPPSRPVRS